jgi:hypothetical protein
MKINDWFIGIVEDVNDPLGQGRVRARCLGYHTADRNELPTEDLPLATSILPTTSASLAGIGTSNTGMVVGTWVFGFFRDGLELQDPVIMGTIATASGYDVGYDVTTNTGFGDPHGAFAEFVGNDIPAAGGTQSSLSSIGVAASQNTTVGDTSANPIAIPNSFDKPTEEFSLNSDKSTAIINSARSQIGIVETSKNHGAGIEKFWASTNYKSGYSVRAPYCAAFACWVIENSGALPSDQLPRTASAFGFIDWAKNKPFAQVRTNPRFVKAGDIVVYAYSHVGIATTNSNASGIFNSCDGNTVKSGVEGVFEKPKKISSLKAAISLTPNA